MTNQPNHPEAREEDVENSPRGLRLVEAPAVETIEAGAPLLEGAELEEVCRVNLDEDDLGMSREKLEAILHREPKRFAALVKALCKRDYDHFLPVKDSSSFVFQRFSRECNRLKKSVSGLLSSLNDTSLSNEALKEKSQNFLPDIARLLALQARSGHHLELEHYPVSLERMASDVKSRVLRDLIRRKAKGEEVSSDLVTKLKIQFKDPVSYLGDLKISSESKAFYNPNLGLLQVLVDDLMDEEKELGMRDALVGALNHLAKLDEKEQARKAKERHNT